MPSRVLFVALAVCLVSLTDEHLFELSNNCLQAAQDDEYLKFELEGARREIYKTVGGLPLHLFIFEPPNHKPSDRRPAAVFFFGGGWVGGSPKQFEAHCQYLASRGLVAIAADYRVQKRHGTTPIECVKDAKSAVRWIRANADRLGIDDQQIAAGGGSAGGHIAAAAGIVPGWEEENEDLKVSSKPNALILFNPVYDNGPDGYGYKRFKERYKEISPLHNIKPGAPPTIVFLGTNDRLIPVETAKRFEAKMKSVGSRCDTHLYEGQPHGFFNKGRNNDKYYRQTVRAMDEFLISLEWLDGNPMIEVSDDQASDSDQGWVTMFNGRSLEGWTQKNGWATYRVEDESIVGRTEPGSPNSFLCSLKEYGDFELEFEVRCDSRLNSGVQIRSTTADKAGEHHDYKRGRVNGPQVEIEASGENGAQAGYIYGEATGRGWLVTKENLVAHKTFKDGGWNHYRVVAEGPRIQTFINGQAVCDLTDADIFETHPRGFIGLQVHGVGDRGPFEVSWRNLRIKELD